MIMERQRELLFVAHRATGVRLVPAEWLDGWRPSGFREASPAEIWAWYAEREIDPPADERDKAACAAYAAAQLWQNAAPPAAAQLHIELPSE